jgi:hypothetical protein
LPRPNWSRPLRRPLTIPTVMDLVTLADVQTLLGRLPKETRARGSWEQVEVELQKAAAYGDTTQASIALEMVLQLENVEYQMKKAANSGRPQVRVAQSR